MITNKDIASLTAAAKASKSAKTFTVTAADASSQNVVIQQLKNHLKKAPNSTIIILTH